MIMCNQACIVDKFHVLFKCDVLNGLRKRYVSTYCCKHPRVIKMNKLFNKHSKVVLINISKGWQGLLICMYTFIYIRFYLYSSHINLINFCFAFLEL